MRFGAPGKPLPPGFAEVQRAYLEGSISLKTALGQTGMSPSTFCRKVKGLPLAGGHREREKGREGGKNKSRPRLLGAAAAYQLCCFLKKSSISFLMASGLEVLMR